MFAASNIVILQHLLPCNEGRSVNPLKFGAWWFLYVPPGLTLKILCTFCAQSTVILFGSQNKQRLFLHGDCILITETECVYCAVRTESLPVI